ncbi:MAG TPA: ATP-grasp domain-containing protein [Pyrinomonadaceae bacterium]|nr:ATP-grasp domain-containing protein [Pyrinomonadaceae bacterium]
MKRVLLLCPTGRERRHLPTVAAALNCRVIFEEFAASYFDRQLSSDTQSDPAELDTRLDTLALIEEILSRYTRDRIEGVTSAVGYPGMPVASIIAERLGLPGTKVETVLLCEHKYYARAAQRKLVPTATPSLQIVPPDGLAEPDAPDIPFPLFLKPVKSCFSINAQTVSSLPELRRAARTSRMPAWFLRPFDDLLKAYTNYEYDASHLLAETLLEGVQVSLEGYVFQGRVHVLGIIDSVMFPNTISFERFVYPSRLPEEVQARMSQIAETFINGIGYDNALFNMELMYNAATGDIHIIEVNPKIASQFPDLFEKVDGTSSYAPLLQVALGEDPKFQRGRGEFKLAASCVLRIFEDRRVVRVPTEAQLAELTRKFPDANIEISVSKGDILSNIMQDGKSFRYGLVNIGANSEQELDAKLEFCKNFLDFQFAAP